MAIQNFLNKHLIAICATLCIVYAYVCNPPIKSILNPHYTFWKRMMLWLWRLQHEVMVLHTIPCSWVPANSVKVKKSLDGGFVTTAGKKNQNSHFKCICLLIYLSRKTGGENDVLILIRHDYIGIIRTLIKRSFQQWVGGVGGNTPHK